MWPTVENVADLVGYQRRLVLIIIRAVGPALLSQSAAYVEREGMKRSMYGLNARSRLVGRERFGTVEYARDQSEEIALASVVCYQVDFERVWSRFVKTTKERSLKLAASGEGRRHWRSTLEKQQPSHHRQ